MENNTLKNIDSMDELKQQFSVLIEKLNLQQINNEKLLKTVMKNKMVWIDKLVYFEVYFIIPFSFCLFYLMHYIGWISLTLMLATVLFVALDIYADFCINKVKAKGWIERDMLSSRLILVKMKKMRRTQLLIDIPMLMAWCVILYSEIVSNRSLDPDFASNLAINIGIGVVIGLIISVCIHKKLQHTNDELIQEIDRLKE